MKEKQAVKRYARSLWQTAQQCGKGRQIYQDLLALRECCQKNPAFATFLGRYDLPATVRKEVCQKVFGGATQDKLTSEFLVLLEQQKKLSWLVAISDWIEIFFKQSEGTVFAQVLLAQPLNEGQRLLLEKKLRAKLGENLEMNFVVKEELLGGFMVLAQGQVYDYSVAGRLERLRRQLVSV